MAEAPFRTYSWVWSEAGRRWTFDVEFHAEVERAVLVVLAKDPSASDVAKDFMRQAAAAALVLREQAPTTGRPPA